MKADGECHFPSCEKRIDWKKWDKPPPGWAHVVITRYAKGNNIVSATVVVCPLHTMEPAPRQTKLETEKKRRPVVIIECTSKHPRSDELVAKAIEHSFHLGEAPLNAIYIDSKKDRRSIHTAWLHLADKLVLYEDLGSDEDVNKILELARDMGVRTERRTLGLEGN